VSKFIQESWLVLVMGIVYALMLAGTQSALSARTEENKKAALNEAIREVVPDTAEAEELDLGGDDYTVYKCLGEDGTLIGWALEGSGPGFVDKIRLVAGLNPEATSITGVKVIENLETPGLGNKIEDPAWAGQYIGLDTTRTIGVEKRPPIEGKNEVQAITGATWSSRYVSDIINIMMVELRPELDAHR
jgi:electron transport complex protein RnfG